MRRIREALRLAYFDWRDRKVLAHLRRGSEWEASRDKSVCKRYDCNEPADELGGYCTTWCAADDRGIQAPDY